ncbi:MAG: hypothetical protein IID41_14865, partial [Planctomycetes bacterium]|nr:hypothetical protein [Planctomycetota bacterium]
FPVVGLVSLIILRRGRAWSRWWVVISSGLLMLLPYGVWAARNLALSGTVEAGKIGHVPELFVALLANTAADAATWFLPSQLAGRLCNSVHPLLIMVPLVVLPLWLTIRALRNRQPEAALPGACAAIAFGALGVMMITKFTEETRYWSVMLPSLALAVLALRPPAHKLGGQVFRILAVLFAMFCGVRFGITRSYLWYAGPLGFYLQQGFLAASIVGGSLYLHRSIRELWQQSNCRKAHLAGMAVSGIVAVGLWWFGHEHDQVAISAFVPLLLIGAFISLPLGQAGRGELLRCLACLLPIVLSWGLGGWSWVEQPQPLTYQIDNILVQVRPDVDRARRILAEGEWPAKFVSNCEEYLIDLFGDHSVIPLPWYRSIARFRGQLPQLPEDAALVKREWLEALRRDGITEPFVMVMFPQFAARAYFYGPADFESEPQLDIEWRLRDDDLHLAICRLVR